jgi:SSS family solute:Na+ symporter
MQFGYDAIKATLDPKYLSMTNVTWYQINWSVTIIPIWFVGMTLYQRIYASKGPKEAKKAGLLPECRMANNGFHGSYSWHVR